MQICQKILKQERVNTSDSKPWVPEEGFGEPGLEKHIRMPHEESCLNFFFCGMFAKVSHPHGREL